MHTFTLRAAAALLLVAAPSLATADVPDGAAARLESFLARHCADCHSGDGAEADLQLDRLRVLPGPPADPMAWRKVLEQLSLGTMPPDSAESLSPDEREVAIRIVRRLLEIPHDAPGPLDLPGFGNYVNHEALFTEPDMRQAASPARLWRISPYIFREAANAVSGRKLLVVKRNQGGEGLHPALPFMTPAHTFRDLALPHRFEEATTELLVDMAWLVAGYQIDSRRAAGAIEAVRQSGTPTDALYQEAIRYQFGLVLQRDPTDDELASLTALARDVETDSGAESALQTVLAAILVSPDAVFRIETGAGAPDEFGRLRLSPRETAFAISYALSDDPPSADLRDAMDAGRLETSDGVRGEVERMLNDPSRTNPRILRFFREYFEYTRCMEIFKDRRILKHYSPDQLVEDADWIVLEALAADRDVLKRLLTTSDYYVNYAGNGKKSMNRPDRRQNYYYELFNLPHEWEWESAQPIALPPGERSGLLTHPAWLISFSDNEKNQAIQRGRWVRMKLLGGTIPDVPIGVDAQLPEDPELTLREKMHVTREEYCWKCHQRMDPLGLPFEQWDDFGIYRTTELDEPVDTTGAIAVGDPELDGAVDDPFAYLDRLASSDRVRQVFVRHAFRYWMGRNETLDDAPTLIDADRAYVESGGSMRALLASLLSSDSFLYRRLPVSPDDSLSPVSTETRDETP